MTATKKSSSILLIFLVASSFLSIQTASAAQIGVNPEIDWWKIGAIVLAIMVVFLVAVMLFKQRLRKLTIMQAVKNAQ